MNLYDKAAETGALIGSSIRQVREDSESDAIKSIQRDQKLLDLISALTDKLSLNYKELDDLKARVRKLEEW